MPLLRVLAAIAAVSLACAPARAQVSPSRVVPSLRTDPATLAPGVWVKYSVLSRSTGKGMLLRLAALKKRDGAQWMELALTDDRRRTVVFAALVEGELDAPKIRKMVVQPAGFQPLQLPPARARHHLPKLTTRDRKGRAKLVRSEKVKVPAGSFKARLLREKRKDGVWRMWLSGDVRGWPLVKLETPQMLMELVAHGKGARSQIRGKPGKVDERVLKQLGLIK